MKINDEKLQKKIGFEPFEAQKKIIEAYNEKRDLRIAAGTRFGKSSLSGYLALKEFLKDQKHVWIVAPTYDLADKVFQYVVRFIGQGFPSLGKRISNRIPQQITSPWGSWIKCKSSENPTSLLGEEVDLVILDEVPRIGEDVWNSYIRQRLTSRQGKSVFIGTPKGQNWFYREWQRAKESDDGASFRFSSLDGVSISPEEFERERKLTPTKIFQQEYEAVFLPESAGVFGSIRDCIRGKREDYNPKHLYLMGVDLGRHEDFTVITVIDRMTNQVVDFHRFNEIDWSFQKERIKAVADKYQPIIYIDATSATVGDAYVTELADEGYSVIGYKIGGNLSKRQLIEKLSVLIDNREISFPEEFETLKEELEIFTYEITMGGVIKYHAPKGSHDDCVISLALACWELEGTPLTEQDGNFSESFSFGKQEF